MSSTTRDGEELVDTIRMGKGMTMTFLHNSPYLTRVSISGGPSDDTLFAPLHWHETHDEIFHVLEGQLEATIGGKTRLYGPEDGDVHIPKGTVHGLKTYPGVKCVLEERTDPMDEEKEMFFRNLFVTGKLESRLLAVAQTAYWGDMRPALPGGIRWLERAVTALLGYYIAPLLGYHRKHLSGNLKRVL